MTTTRTAHRILVWDLPTRVSHWLLAGGFALAWLTGESEEWRLVHAMAGGTMVAAALFRVLWGLIGTRYACFADFTRGPRAAAEYLKSLLGPQPEHHVGHNPAGGWAILALLALALASGATGWLHYQDIGGEWLEEAHEAMASLMLTVVAIHLLGVLVGSLKHRENLARAMITGRKRGHQADAIGGSRPIAALVLLGWAVMLAWWMAK